MAISMPIYWYSPMGRIQSGSVAMMTNRSAISRDSQRLATVAMDICTAIVHASSTLFLPSRPRARTVKTAIRSRYIDNSDHSEA